MKPSHEVSRRLVVPKASPVYKEAPQSFRSLIDASLLGSFSYSVQHLGDLVLPVQIRDLSRLEDVVDVFQEALLLDLQIVRGNAGKRETRMSVVLS